ncbi:MAG: hypothetical protein ACXVEI_12715 [Actinomycetota bacterium]
MAVAAVMLHRGDGFPESITGLPRIHSDRVRAIEDAMAHTQFAGVSFRIAMYGTTDTPELIIERFDGVPDAYLNATSEQILDESVRSFEATSFTTVDTERMVTRTIDGVSYTCAPVSPEPATQSTFSGSLCVWKAGDIGLVITVRTSDPAAAIDDVRSAYDSLH